ncbi:MAG: carboxypeptidase regulatory-like domain-containing protein, partial [Polyangiaceae bacterium]
MPGSTTRPILFERVAPPIPDSLKNRDSALDVLVETLDHAPVRNARVRALSALDDGVHLAGEAMTGANGHASLAKLPHGATWILVDAHDLARGSTMLVLEKGSRSISLELENEHTLDVDAKDDHGAPLANAEIEIVGADPLPIGSRVEMDGSAHVGRLGPGPYIVTARAPGYEEITRHGVKEGEEASFVLRRMGTISVHVVGEHDDPLAHANVEVAGAELWPARTTSTDDHGDVKIAALPDGSYALRAFKDSRVSPIELDVALHGGDDRAITLRLGEGSFVVARVVQEGLDAEPVDGAAVTVAESGLTPFPIEAVTNKDGRVRIGPILPGDATISARSEGFVASNAIAIGTPVPPEIPIVLVKAGTLEGRVVDARGFPIDGATIEVIGTDFSGAPIDDDPRHRAFRAAHFMANLAGAVPLVPMGELGVVPGPVPPIPHATGGSVSPNAPPDSPEAAPWVSKDDGTFSIAPVSPGRVRLMVRHPQYVETASDVVTLTSGGTAHVDVVMHAGGSLEGRVLDPNDQPAPNVRVTVSATRGALERTTLTAEDGTFAFASLPLDVSVSAALEDDPSSTLVRVPVTIADGAHKSITLNLPAARKELDLQVV